jgi:hypothetical protein
MTLSFSQTINGKPNYFIEKIWNGLLYGNHGEYHYSYNVFLEEYREKFKNDWDGHPDNNLPPKLHTIRLDPHNRWKPGNLIHPVIKPEGRFSAGFQFSPVIKCVSVQTIEILYFEPHKNRGFVYVDGLLISGKYLQQLAINDGFDSIEDFFAYFNKDFTGKIIHWTDLKY